MTKKKAQMAGDLNLKKKGWNEIHRMLTKRFALNSKQYCRI